MNASRLCAGLLLVLMMCVFPPVFEGSPLGDNSESFLVADLLLETLTGTDVNVVVAYQDGGGTVPSYCAVLAAQRDTREAIRSIALAGGLTPVEKGSITVIAGSKAITNLQEPLWEIEFRYEKVDLLGIIRTLTDSFGRMGMNFNASLRDDVVVFSVGTSGQKYLERYLELIEQEEAIDEAAVQVFPKDNEYVSIKSVRADLADTVRLLLRHAGINFVSTVPLKGEVIVNLKNVHRMRALTFILRVFGLDFKRIPNGILVEPLPH